MLWVNDPSIHPLILDYIAIYGGEAVEINPEAMASWALPPCNTHAYLTHVENLRETLMSTRLQSVLFLDPDPALSPLPRFVIEHPQTGSFNNPPGGTFHRFTRQFQLGPQPAQVAYIRRLREWGA